MARAIWSGVITFGMVSIPIELYPASQDKDVAFHQLHRPDHSRIKYKKFCATEDIEVDQDEIVRAYEVSHDHYREALLELIKSKTEGREVVVPQVEAGAAPVTDLMAALRASICRSQTRRPPARQRAKTGGSAQIVGGPQAREVNS